MPLVLLVAGIGTFVLIGIAGLSVIERYLIVAALALLVFAAVAFGGFTMLRPGALCADRGWSARSRSCSPASLFTATRVNLDARSATSCSSAATPTPRSSDVLHDPAVQRRAALRPADAAQPQARARLALDRRPAVREGRARAPTRRWGQTRGAASRIYVTSRFAIFKHACTNADDPADIQVPPAGAARVAANAYYSAYVRC